MKTDGQILRGLETVLPHVDPGAVQEWVKETFTVERMVEAGLLAATVTVTAYLGAVLLQGIQTYSLSGF